MEFATGMELAKGLSDLAIVIACIPAALYVDGKATSPKCIPLEKLWFKTLLLLGIAAMMGAALHSIIFFHEIAFRCFWAVLYLVMIAAGYFLEKAVIIMFQHAGFESRARIIPSPWLAAAFFVACAGIRLVTGQNTILIFVVYGIILLAHIVYLSFRALKGTSAKGPEREDDPRREGGPFATLLKGLIPLALAIVCQALFGQTGVFPDFPIDGAVLAHVFIIISVAMLARCAAQSVQREDPDALSGNASETAAE